MRVLSVYDVVIFELGFVILGIGVLMLLAALYSCLLFVVVARRPTKSDQSQPCQAISIPSLANQLKKRPRERS